MCSKCDRVLTNLAGIIDTTLESNGMKGLVFALVVGRPDLNKGINKGTCVSNVESNKTIRIVLQRAMDSLGSDVCQLPN